MRLLFLALFAALFSFTVFSAELDAVVSKLESLNGQVTVVSTAVIDTFNCKDAAQTEPKFEFTIIRPPECDKAMDIYYSRFDFVSGAMVSGGRICTLPTGLACKAEVPVRLGGKGNSSITQDLVRVYGDCNGITYEKTFSFAINHHISTSESNVLGKISAAESAISANPSSQASQALSDARSSLARCALTDAFSNATAAINLAGAGQAVPSQAQPPGTPSPITIPAQPPGQQPGAQPQPPSTPTQPPTTPQPPASTQPPSTPPQPAPTTTPAAPSSTPAPSEQAPSKTCGIFLAFLPLAAFVLTKK